MGNSASSSSLEASDAQVDQVFTAMKEAFEKTAAANIDKDLLLLKLRSKFQQEFPSAMGSPRIDPDITACIGQTNLVRINNTLTETPRCEVVAKVEYTNPALSVKDRIAISMIENAEKEGIIKPGETTIVDMTSGNTGVAYGMVAVAKGYKCIQIIPEPYSVERRALMLAYGVDVVVTSKTAGMAGALKKYTEILNELGDKAYAPRQFDNPANIAAHYAKTGPEIWEQCGGKVDVIVTGYGTGGTISGVTKFLRQKNPNFVSIAVEPMEASMLNGDDPAPHGIQGLAPPFVPDNVKVELFDEVIRCPTEEALATSKQLARMDGIACGISAGANVWSACQVAQRPEFAGKRIVTILPSAAERYMSTPLYADLMEQAKSLQLATVDESIPVEGANVNLRNLKTIQESGIEFRPNFHVS